MSDSVAAIVMVGAARCLWTRRETVRPVRAEKEEAVFKNTGASDCG